MQPLLKYTASVVFFGMGVKIKFVGSHQHLVFMVALLIAILVLLIAVMVYLNLQFYREKRAFAAKVKAIHAFMEEIVVKQNEQQGKVRLSDELTEKMKSSKITLNDQIFDLHYSLFDLLSKNNLLKRD